MIDVLIAGDLCTDGRIESKVLADPAWSCFNSIEDILLSKDLSIVNLECPLTLSKKKIIKSGPSLKAHPNTISILKSGFFDVVTLANNHIMDYGEEGLKDTLSLCDETNIKYVGIGKHLKDASEPLYIDIKNRTIAIINFAENEFSIATPNSCGANPLNPIQNYYQIQLAKQKADIILVIVHGGNEYYELPSPRFKETLRFFIDAGASAVIAHHTHFASGYEIYREAPIFYGLGNFLFDRENKTQQWYESFLLKISFRHDLSYRFNIIPFIQNYKDLEIVPMVLENKKIFEKRLDELVNIIGDDIELNNRWKDFILTDKKYYITSLLSVNKFSRMLLQNDKSLSWFLHRKKITRILNQIKCESHREVLISILMDELNKGIIK